MVDHLTPQTRKDSDDAKSVPEESADVSFPVEYQVVPWRLALLRTIVSIANGAGGPFVGLQTVQGFALISGGMPPANFSGMPPQLEAAGLLAGLLESAVLRNIQVVPHAPETHRKIFEALPTLQAPRFYNFLLASVAINSGVLGYGSSKGWWDLTQQASLETSGNITVNTLFAVACIPGTIAYGVSFSGKELIDAANAIGSLTWRYDDTITALWHHGRQWVGALPDVLANGVERVGPYVYIGQNNPFLMALATASATVTTAFTRSRLALEAASQGIRLPGEETLTQPGYAIFEDTRVAWPMTIARVITAGIRPALPLAYWAAQSCFGDTNSALAVLQKTEFWGTLAATTIVFSVLRAPEQVVFDIQNTEEADKTTASTCVKLTATLAMVTFLGIRVIYNANYWNLLGQGLFRFNGTGITPGVVLGLTVALTSMPPEVLMRYNKFIDAIKTTTADNTTTTPISGDADADTDGVLRDRLLDGTSAAAKVLTTPQPDMPFESFWQAATCCYLRPRRVSLVGESGLCVGP